MAENLQIGRRLEPSTAHSVRLAGRCPESGHSRTMPLQTTRSNQPRSGDPPPDHAIQPTPVRRSRAVRRSRSWEAVELDGDPETRAAFAQFVDGLPGGALERDDRERAHLSNTNPIRR
jgi:hypothetical protein